MTKIDKNTREVLKKIPSIDEILKRFTSSSESVPIDFLKFNINRELQDIRDNFIKGLKVIGKFFFSVEKKRLKNFRNDGLLILGEFEVLYNPKKISKKIKKLIPNLNIQIINDAGHAAIYDQPNEVNNLVISFLSNN